MRWEGGFTFFIDKKNKINAGSDFNAANIRSNLSSRVDARKALVTARLRVRVVSSDTGAQIEKCIPLVN